MKQLKNNNKENQLKVLSTFFLGLPPAYPPDNRSQVHKFKKSLEELNINVIIEKGSHSKDKDGNSLGKANVDPKIIAFLYSNILTPYLTNRALPINQYRSSIDRDKGLQDIYTQYEKYLLNPPISVVIFTGDEDFLPVAQQIRDYSEGHISVYFASHPCITSGEIKNDPYFINLEEILEDEDYTPPWNTGTVITVTDGNNLLNAFRIGGVWGMSDREDFPLATRILGVIHSRLRLI
jgi:hypothetical protein